MIRLIANTDIGSISFTSRSHTNVARIAVAPTATGSSAATTLRKTTSDSRNSSGKASSSARARSCSICSLTCMKASRPPPAVTPGLALDALLQPLGGGVLVHAGAEGGEQVGRAAVAGDELGRLAAADGDHLGDVGVAQRARDARDLLARLRGVDRCAEPHERDQVGRRRPSGRALDRVAREDRLRAVVLEVVVAVEQRDDRAAERAREQHEDDREGEDEPAAADDQAGKAVHARKTGWSLSARSRAATTFRCAPVAKKLQTSSGVAPESSETSLTTPP